MDLTAISWKKVAIVVGVAGAVATAGFLSSNTGPVQGSASWAAIHRSGDACMFEVNLAFGDKKDKEEAWLIYMSDLECIVSMDSQGGSTRGRPAVYKSIEALKP